MLFLGISAFGQIPTDKALNDLKKLNTDFISFKQKFENETLKFNSLKDQITPKSTQAEREALTAQGDLVNKAQEDLDRTYKIAEATKIFYEDKKVSKKDLDENFSHQHTINTIINTTPEPVKTFFFFGDKKVIDEKDDIFKNKTVSAIFDEILNTNIESYLGDFSIPKKGAKIEYEQVTREKKFLNLKKSDYKTNQYLYFKAIKMHAFEGSLVDIRLFVTDDNNNEYVFQNKVATSLLKLSRLSHNDFLYLKPIKINGKDIEVDGKKIEEKKIKFKFYRIKLSDVLDYTPNAGNNYVPEDEVFDFPLIKNDTLTNENAPAKYKVISDSSLQNTVELRTYTDFLALFGNAPNGIVQLEGKADFFVSPFSIPHTNLFLFKKITPFVAFSKIESDVRNLTLESVNATTSKIKQPLEILEKSYLRMGLNLNVLTYKFTKEFPFDIGIFGTARYLIADLPITESTAVNYKSIGLGGGLAFEFKRFNNFGLICRTEWTNYDTKGLNTIAGIENPSHFVVFKNEAEVYYSPYDNKKQSIFLRFRSFNDATPNIDDAFYQLQFGYRFSIGTNKLKQ